MPTVTFIRHAETTLNKSGNFCGRTDCDITEEGRRQAQQYEGEKNFDYTYCSPLKRTMQTLEAMIPGSKPIIDDRITEISIGEWEGKDKSSVDQNLRALYRAGQYNPPGAETTAQVDARVIDFIKDLFEQYKKGESILVVTHNGVMRSIKRNFVREYGDIMNNNLGSIVLTDEDFEYYRNKAKDEESR